MEGKALTGDVSSANRSCRKSAVSRIEKKEKSKDGDADQLTLPNKSIPQRRTRGYQLSVPQIAGLYRSDLDNLPDRVGTCRQNCHVRALLTRIA